MQDGSWLSGGVESNFYTGASINVEDKAQNCFCMIPTCFSEIPCSLRRV